MFGLENHSTHAVDPKGKPTTTMADFSSSTFKKITSELRDLQLNPPEGIVLMLNEENITDIQAFIQGPSGTPFQKGAFKVKITLGQNFPASPPSGHFITKIFHPNVAPSTGEICVSTLKKDWKPETTLSQLLLIIKCLLIAPNPESALNEEAGKLLLEDYESYFKHAKLMTSIHATKSSVDFSNPTATDSLEKEKSIGVLTHSKNKTNTSASLSPQKRSADAAGVQSSGSSNNTTKKASTKDKKSLRRL